jgi:hypothetical protein
MEPSAVYTKNRLVKLGVSLLPDHMKRLLFLVGLTETQHFDTEDKAVAARLNQVLQLVNHEAAIGSAAMVRGLLWKDSKMFEQEIQAQRGFETTLPEQDPITAWARRIVGKMPAWLVYNDPSKMVEDVCKVLTLKAT